MSKTLTIRLQDAELRYVKEQALRGGQTQTEIVRSAIWRDAAVAEIREQTKLAVQQEFDILFARLTEDFKSELQLQLSELREIQKGNFAKLGGAIVEQIQKIKGN